MTEFPTRQIRAQYDETTIRVYQAFNNQIADSALTNGTFTSPAFKMERMTWIKPSFLWMMYRCGWAQKDDGQRRVLAIDISRSGFEWALQNGLNSKPSPLVQSKEEWQALKKTSTVRIQWDPERDLYLEPLAHRSIQIGLTRLAVNLYCNEWISKITDITPLARKIQPLIIKGDIVSAKALLPKEAPYPVSNELSLQLGMPD